LNDASTDPVQIDRWWQQWPDANIGTVTGVQSGVLVFDVDPRNGGDQSYKQLQIEIPDAFADLLEVRTGSGGVHLYFECRNHIPSRANIRPGIDIKADGGYVVAPPSRHISGSRYRFVSIDGMVPRPLPKALLDLILGDAQAHAFSENPPKVEIDALRLSDPIKVLLRDGKPKGERSEAIFAVTRALIKAGHSDDEIMAVLMDPANRLSEKPRVKGLAWLTGEVKRAHAKPDQSDTSITQPGGNHVLICRPASEIQPEPIRWLWTQRIALGKISLIAGQPGLGKSQITTYLTAVTSSGANWPTGEPCSAGDALILSAEDDPADTIRPRLEASGATLDRVHIVYAVRDKRGDRLFNLRHDLAALETKLKANTAIKLVIIDPISAYLGGIDSHNNSEVRGLLAPLARMAANHGVAVVCVTHLNKGSSADKSSSADPLTRVIGSMAFGATVRTAFIILPEKINSEGRLFLLIKSNISRPCSGLAFHLETHVLPSGIETSRVVWEPKPVTITASEALLAPTQDEIDDWTKLLEECLRVFDFEKATELPASRLIDLLNKNENRLISPKQLKKSLGRCGIHQHRRSEANYYFKADFP
jgi:hypothetical protein